MGNDIIEIEVNDLSIEVKNLTYRYNQGETKVFALNDVNLTIKKGSFTAIIGTNGSGKSTLARHFNGLLQPTKGCCLVDGLDTQQEDKLWQVRQKVGMVFQNPDNQIIAAIVEDDVAFGPENLGVAPEQIRQRVDESLRAVRMEKRRDFAPHLLSGGQKQLVAIAGALAMRTDYLVLDEPTAMLDPTGRRAVLDAVHELHDKHGITVILITHFMEETVDADEIVVMEKGKAVAIGTPQEIFSDAEKIKKLGLEVPLASQLSEQLRTLGMKLPREIYKDEQLLKALSSNLGY